MGFRHVVLLLTFTGVASLYITRACFSVALASMVVSSESSTPNEASRDDSCSENFIGPKNQTSLQSLNDSKPNTQRFGATYNWDADTQSFMLAALFYGSLVSQMPSGMLVQHFNVRWIFGLTNLASAILNLMTPVAFSWGPGAVIALRAVQGVLQGAQTPVGSQVVSDWFPRSERSRAFGFIWSGPSIGSIVGMSVSGVLAASETLGGWPSIFYVFGIFGCVWSVIWMTLVSNAPQHHKCVSDCEMKIIRKDQEDHPIENAPVPWKDIFTSLPFWSFTIGAVGQLSALIVMMTELPIFFTNVFHFDNRLSGLFSAIPFFLRFLMALLGSCVADALGRGGKLSVTSIRKLLNTIGTLGFCLCLVVIAFVGCQKYLIVALLCISNGFCGISISGCMVANVDLNPTFSATTSAISSTISLFVGALMPYVVGLLTSSGHTVGNWSSVFLLFSGMVFATGLQFLIFGSAEKQSWGATEQKEVAGISNPALETGEVEVDGIENQSLETKQTSEIESTRL